MTLIKQFFTYYNYDHDGHIMTSAGFAKMGQFSYRGGYVDPYDEDDPGIGVDGGANTGGFHTLRISKLYSASEGNAKDMIW